ncbi:hypothetical protein TRFO_04521 [Tritrichomonas foetus]|uniref:Uncharacterized protein n=1 Tax=Tritrichomonas foetus TaxID=1144522 RepID=A0A1J4KE39_9EUKA|nr:hypothetical protein TRFO_04521 [Tritrichomonas foetus]|eukprot:OHT09459.1 hypothetical protein TRFO_04521 [Tritrichomonas foetus]
MQIRFNDFIEDAILQYQRVKSHGGWEAIEARLKSLPNVANASNRATQADKILSEILGNNYEIDQLSQFLAQREDDSRLVDEIRNEFGDEITVRDLTLVESQDNSHLGKMTRELFENQGNEKLTEDQIIEQLKDLKAKLNDYKDNTLIAEEARLLTNNENHEETIENLQSTFKLANNVRNIISSNNDIELSEKLSQSVALMKELQELLEVNADSIPEKVRSLQQNTLNQDLQNELEEVKKQRQNFENELWETKKLLTAAQDEELFAKKVRAIYGNSDDNDNLICAKNDHNLASAIRIIYENQNVSDEFIPQSIVRDHDLATPIRELFQLADDNAIIEKIRNNQSEASDNSLIGNLSNKLEAIRNVKLAEQLKEELTQETERVQSLTSELDKLRNELNEKSNELENLKNEFNNTNSQIRNQDQANNNELNNIRNELNSKNEELNNLRNEIENKNNELNSKNEEINGLKRDQEFSQRVRNIFPNDSDENIPEYISKDVKLASRVRGIFQSGDDAFITESIENNKNASSTNAQEHEALNNTTQALSSLRQELESKNNELNSKNGELDNLRNELSNKNNEIESKSNELNSLRNELENNNNEFNSKSTELDNLRNELNNLRNELNDKNSQLQNLDQETTNEYNNLRNEIKSKNDEINHIRDEISHKNNELNAKNSELENLHNEINNKNDELDRLRNELSNSQNEIGLKNNEHAHLIEELNRHKNQLEALQNEINTQQQQHQAQQQADQGQNNEEIERLRKELEDTKEELKNALEDLEGRDQDIESLHAKILELGGANTSKEIEDLTAKLAQMVLLRKEAEDLKNQLENVSAELDLVKSDRDQYIARLEQANINAARADNEKNDLSHKLELYKASNIHQDVDDNTSSEFESLSKANAAYAAENAALTASLNDHREDHAFAEKLRNILPGDNDDARLGAAAADHKLSESIRSIFTNDSDDSIPVYVSRDCSFSKDIRVFFSSGDDSAMLQRIKDNESQIQSLKQKDSDSGAVKLEIEALKGQNNALQAKLDKANEIAEKAVANEAFATRFRDVTRGNTDDDKVYNIQRDTWLAIEIRKIFEDSHADETIPRRVKDLIDEHENLKNEKSNLLTQLNNLLNNNNTSADVENQTNEEIDALKAQLRLFAGLVSAEDCTNEECFDRLKQNTNLANSVRNQFNYPNSDRDNEIPQYISKDMALASTIRVLFSSGDDEMIVERIKSNEFRSSQELIEARTNFDRLNNIFSTIRAIVIESGNVDVEHFLEDQIVDEVRETFRFAKECRESQDSNDSSLLDSILTLFKPGTTPESIKQWKNRLVQSVDTFTANEDLLADIREIFELASAENLPNIIKEMREEGDPTLTRNADILDEAMKGSNLKVEIEGLMTMVLVLFTQYMLVPPEQ